jgi:hypothetical protein
MRNILEATKTYSIGKTYSFSGRSAANRQLKPCNFLTGFSSSSFSVEILPILPNTRISNQQAYGSEARNRFAFAQQSLPANHKIPEDPALNSRPISVNKSKSVYKSYSDAHWAYCSNIKKPNKVDCTITPVSVLKQYDVSVNQAIICTLGEVAAMPDFLFETKFLQHAVGKKPVFRV